MVSSVMRVFAVLLGVAIAARHLADVAHHSDEGATVVPREISRALQKAQKRAETKLQDLQRAEEVANSAKAIADSTASTKMSLMEEMKAKAVEKQAHAEASRQALVQAETAASQHMSQNEEFEAALARWNGLSQAAEGMQENVTMMEEAIAATLARMQRHLEALKDERDAKIAERDAAERDMMEKKTKVLSANKLQAATAKSAADAEQTARQAQQELRSLQASFDRAVSKATKAEIESKQAAGFARDAKNEHEAGKMALGIIRKLQVAINVFYKAIDKFVYEEASGALENSPDLKEAYAKYNLMAGVFAELSQFSPERYLEVIPAIHEIERNYQAAIAEKCDPNGSLMDEDFEPLPEFDEQCGSGLWGKAGMTQQKIPLPSAA